MSDWEQLGYRELQAECKAAGLSAKGTRGELVTRLQEHGGQPSAAAAQPTSPRPAKTPRTAAKTPRAAVARKAAAEPAGVQSEGEQTPAARRTTPRATKAALLEAARTPLPKGTTPSNGAKLSARKPRRATAARPSLGRLLTFAALAAALSALAVPAWTKYEVGPQLRQRFPGPMQQVDALAAATEAAAAKALARAHAVLPAGLVGAAQQHLAAGRAFVEQRLADAQRTGAYLRHEAQRRVEEWQAALTSASSDAADTGAAEPAAAAEEPAAPSHTPNCSGIISGEAIKKITPPDEMWDNLRQAALAAWAGQRVDPTKATAFLFACIESHCKVMKEWLVWAVTGGAHCKLVLDASELGEDRGALQKSLAAFFTAEPKGTVVISNIQQLSPELLPVLINALSEQGGFVVDGRSVATAGGTFLFTMPLERELLSAESEAAFKVNAKAALVQALAARSAAPEETLAHAKALRRRIEFVLPTVH